MSAEKAEPVVPVMFCPNDFGKSRFNLRRDGYYGNGVTPLLLDVLGRESVEEYVVASDPFGERKDFGRICVCFRNNGTPRVHSIGTIYRLG